MGDTKSYSEMWRLPMRRAEKLMDEAGCQELLRCQQVGRLGITDGEFVYVVPVFYVYVDGQIIIHSATAGLKIDMLGAGKTVCFEVDEFLGMTGRTDACSWSARFSSVICFGRARIVDDEADKKEMLRVFCRGITGGKAEHEGTSSAVSVIVIDVEQMTGKISNGQ